MFKARILIADKHQVVTRGLRNVLQNKGHVVVGEASTTDQAMELARLFSPDLVITDFPLADNKGRPTIASIHKAAPRARIVIFTSRSNAHFSSGFWHRSVWGSALKENPLSDLLYAIDEVSHGRTSFGPMNEMTDPCDGTPSKPHMASTGDELLGTREAQVFLLLANGHTVTEIAGELGVSPKTVETQKSRILKKLNARNILDLTRIALRRGVIAL